MAEVSEEDLERLASRMAMLVSEAGEADNAGRAVASLARRIGMSGGQLKAFFLAGAAESLHPTQRTRRPNDAIDQVDRLERELSAVRHGLKLTEVQARNAMRERDALRVENNALLEALDRTRSTGLVGKYLGVAAIAAMLLGSAVLYAAPSLHKAEPVRVERHVASPSLRAGVIRYHGANVLRAPEQGAMLVVLLPAGTQVGVRQVVWRALMQWAEIEVDGMSGYVLTTDIDLS